MSPEIRRISAFLFIGVFLYSILIMGVSRKLIIPWALPEFSEDGEIFGDTLYFRQLAEIKANIIKKEGMGAFELRPEGQGPAGLGSLFFLFGNYELFLIITNSLLHSVSTVLVFLILLNFFSLKTSLISVIPMFFSPTMMVWLSQLNKDSYVVAGVLCVIFASLKIVNVLTVPSAAVPRHFYLVTLGTGFTGLLLNFLMKPYMNLILLVSLTIGLLWVVVNSIFGERVGVNNWFHFGVSSAIFILLLSFFSTGGAASANTINNYADKDFKEDVVAAAPPVTPESFSTSAPGKRCLYQLEPERWKELPFLPSFLQNQVRTLMAIRCLTFSILDNANTLSLQYGVIDEDRLPGGTLEALLYFPRGLAIGAFSPWPSDWFFVLGNSISMLYKVCVIESWFMYLGLVGWIFLFLNSRKRNELYVLLIFLFISMSIIGIANPFLLVIQRYRYPFWVLLLGVGVGGVFALIHKLKSNYHSIRHV